MITDEAIDETGDWFIFPVSDLVVKSTVILRLHAEANAGSINEIHAELAKLKEKNNCKYRA